jgi:hypothetical protein
VKSRAGRSIETLARFAAPAFIANSGTPCHKEEHLQSSLVGDGLGGKEFWTPPTHQFLENFRVRPRPAIVVAEGYACVRLIAAVQDLQLDECYPELPAVQSEVQWQLSERSTRTGRLHTDISSSKLPSSYLALCGRCSMPSRRPDLSTQAEAIQYSMKAGWISCPCVWTPEPQNFPA